MSWLNPLTWPIEPWVLLGVEVTAILYIWGRPTRRRQASPSPWWGGTGRGLREGSFWLALAVIIFALDTPLEWLARQLFWAHMTQHLLLIMVAAPLLVVASPWLQLWRGLPLRLRRPLARTIVKHPLFAGPRRLYALIGTPVAAWILSSANLWFWHWPSMYDLTLRNHAVHHLEHALFLGLGILFWAQVIDQYPFHARLSQIKRVAYVFTATIQAWALAALLAFANAPYYAYAALPSRPGGISALTDQQFGAGIMWVPGALTYAIVFIACLYLWFRDEDLRAQALAASQVGIAR
ncbi:MAG TPA: cytochrome c oxidase assembly protein [Candidatus Dormibacteraeota bacterium]|nr:cytochrome c oxidase assembly protein [Candidatus Dormibacteraeota bacterium]